MRLDNGMDAVVTGLSETEVEIDANHELAGQALTFAMELRARAGAARTAPLPKLQPIAHVSGSRTPDTARAARHPRAVL